MVNSKADTAVMIYTVSLGFIMACIATFALIICIMKTNFRWVQLLFLLSLLQDLGTCQFMLFTWLEQDNSFRARNEQLVAWGVATALFNFFGLNNLIYWLYGFKYWVIAREVPAAYKIKAGPATCHISERGYTAMKWVGIVANLGLAAFLAISRYRLSIGI